MSPRRIVLYGLVLLVFCLVSPLVLVTPVAVLSCIVPHCPLLIHGLMLPVASFSASFPFVVSLFVFAVCMPQPQP